MSAATRQSAEAPGAGEEPSPADGLARRAKAISMAAGDAGSIFNPPLDNPLAVFRPHWHIYLPTAVIALLYAFGWLLLVAIGRIDTGLARLFVVVLAVGVPLLLAHAFLRYQTIRIEVLEGAIRFHRGWPAEGPVVMPCSMIRAVRVRRGLSGRLFGGGTVALDLITGDRTAIADMRDPDGACAAIEDVCGPAISSASTI